MDDDTPPSSEDGRTEFVDWEEAKERLRHRIRIVPDSE